ncbi:MAG TPA: hypothetical protein VH583_10945 [Vicinamibacterales bacterium]|jgi:hypothetical protein
MTAIDTARTLVVLALTVLGVSGGAAAQEVASSFEQLRVLVRPSDHVKVIEPDGREVKGVVHAVSDETLTLRVHGREESIPQSRVSQIQTTWDDPLANGARNGFIVGAVLGGLSALALVGDTRADLVFVPYAVLVDGGLGAAIGAGVDALITSQRVIYDSRTKTSASAVSVVPLLTRQQRGLALSLRF